MTRMFTRATFLSVAILGSATLVSAAGAQAETFGSRTDDQQSVQIVTTDFSQPAQVHSLYGRIKAAAHAVCTSDGAVDPRTQDADATCEAQAVRDAVREINQPQLSREDDRNTGNAQQYAWNDRSH